MREKTTFGVGIIGFGFIGKMHALAHVSLPYYYRNPGFRTTLKGVATSRGESAMQAISQGGFEFGTTDPYELIHHPDVDLVHICSPNDTHAEFARAAFQAGKDVYCEKPLARTLAEAREMEAAANASGKTHQVAFQYRFVPALLRAKEIIRDGLLGTPLSFRIHYLHSGYVDPNRPMSWRLNAERSGGGALHDLGSHAVDLLRHLFGEPARVFASLRTFIGSRPVAGNPAKTESVEVDDLALLQLELDNGAVGTIEASRIATGTTDDLLVELHGSTGAVKFSLMEPNWLHVYDGKADSRNRGFVQIQTVQTYPEPATFPSPKTSVGWTRFHVAGVFDFLSNVVNDRIGSPSFSDGVAVQATLEAAQRSAAEGRWTEIAPR